MRRMSSSQTTLTLPSLSGAWVRGNFRDRAPWILAALAAGSIGSLIFAAATSAPVASRLEMAQMLAHQAVINTTAQMGMRVSEIGVAGRAHTTGGDILKALEINVGEPLLALDPEAARTRLETLPWVKQALVERVLPGAIRIHLVERTPVALWQTRSGAFHLVDADGVVIADQIQGYESLPVVVGSGAPDAASDLLAMLNAQPALAARMTAAVRFGQRRWDLWFDGYGVQPEGDEATSVPVGVQVRLPETGAELALARLARLEAEHNILERDVAVIDLRQDDRLILRRSFSPGDAQTPDKPATKPWPGLPIGGPSRDA